jgi:hypothetical protein
LSDHQRASGKGGTGKTIIATNFGKGYQFWGYFPCARAFTQGQVEGKTILEYDNND